MFVHGSDLRTLAEVAGGVVLGFLALLEEDLVGPADFDQLAKVHIRSEIGGARRLLHVDGDKWKRTNRLGVARADERVSQLATLGT